MRMHGEDFIMAERVIVCLDKAQAMYGEIYSWEVLCNGSELWMPRKNRFIISATYGSPYVYFAALPALTERGFLLSANECHQLLMHP